eukprot:3780460-Rhodomonas_salina.1
MEGGSSSRLDVCCSGGADGTGPRHTLTLDPKHQIGPGSRPETRDPSPEARGPRPSTLDIDRPLNLARLSLPPCFPFFLSLPPSSLAH